MRDKKEKDYMLPGYRKRKLEFSKRYGGRSRIINDKKYRRKNKHKDNYEFTR